MSADFDGTPLVAGSVVGVRGFNVDDDGWLRGLFHASAFRPGVNEAQHRGISRSGGRCGLPSLEMAHALNRIQAAMAGRQMSTPLPTRCASPGCEKCGNPSDMKHRVAGLNCTCGYYAYFDDRPSGAVAAVIEGTGVVTLGSRGFRAQKAQLVALVDPHAKQPGTHDRWDRWSDWHYKHDGWNSAMAVPIPFVAIWTALLGSGGAIATGIAWLAALIVPLAIVAAVVLAACSVKGWRHGLHRHYGDIHPELSCVERRADVGAELFAVVRRNYPDVPVYPSLKAALAAHPATQPDLEAAS